jgi:hypothetical protein
MSAKTSMASMAAGVMAQNKAAIESGSIKAKSVIENAAWRGSGVMAASAALIENQ